MLNEIISSLRLESFLVTVKFILSTSPVWLPLFLLGVFTTLWLKYARTRAMVKAGGVLLEIKLPRDVFKSPMAMEIIITSLFQTGSNSYLETFVKGKQRPWFSLEIISIEGNVRFFIWTQPKYRQLIESQFYAQYPGVEIYEAEDYTKNVFVDAEKIQLWGTAFKLGKPDIYPIKTYIDYGLDKEQEEESKVDPMTSVLEFLGSIKAGEQVWIQILIQAHRKNSLKEDAVFPQKTDWEKEAKEEIEKKIAEVKGSESEEGAEGTIYRIPTKSERELIDALERSLTKYPFEVGIRGFYIARKESFDSIGITGLIGSFRQYSSRSLNEIKLGQFTDFDYPWDDFLRIRRTTREVNLLNAYKLRSYFQLPYRHYLVKPFILTTEEIATIFHLPGKVAGTPTLTKIASRKSEAPANLPI